MLCMLFIERLRLFHCFRKHEGFLFSWRQCCMCVLGMEIRGARLADSSRSERGLVTAAGLASISFSLPSVSWHCDSIELHEWGIHLRPASLPRVCPLLTGTLLLGSIQEFQLWKFVGAWKFVEICYWRPSWSHQAALSEQTWGNPGISIQWHALFYKNANFYLFMQFVTMSVHEVSR